jgi:hypothetical protein
MSFTEDEDAFVGREHLLAKVHSESVKNILAEFPLPLQPGKDFTWLAGAVRRALAITILGGSFDPDRRSNAEVRAELEQLAGKAQETWQELFRRSHAADWKLWGAAGRLSGQSNFLIEPPMYRRFTKAVSEIDWLASLLLNAANETENQPARWRQSEVKSARVYRGRCLAPIFEAAFGARPTANNWRADGWRGDAQHRVKTPFMDFYQRMVSLAFEENVTQDLSGVLKEACRLHRKDPVQFGEYIPGI